MLHYPVSLQDDDGTVFVKSRDFPELTTFGDDVDEAIARAADALEEAIAARIAVGQEIPDPYAGGTRVKVPALTAIKALLYQGMRKQGIGKAELARRLGWHLRQVDRVLDVRHKSRLDRMVLALSAIGLQIEVHARETGSNAQR
ncbi:MAG: type II toxin-antitoxin system HicB family antitoxin [Paracoccaceae bacterium]|nr:type II toxin-antitoxin system HicB family antitoxin [Paracoccaceae bacterium]